MISKNALTHPHIIRAPKQRTETNEYCTSDVMSVRGVLAFDFSFYLSVTVLALNKRSIGSERHDGWME